MKKIKLSIDIQKQWFLLDYLYDYLSFNEDILSKLCTFIIIIPLYYYLSILTNTIHSMLFSYIRWLRFKKDYDLIKPILEEYDERINIVEQIDLNYQFQIENLSLQYEGTREGDEDQVKQQRTSEIDLLVWNFLRLVQIDDFVRNELKSDLDAPIENKISGGKKTRLLLARALYRAHHRNSSLLILDEPDQDLPAETTVTIIDNIIKWYCSKGILFLTLHTERAHLLNNFK